MPAPIVVLLRGDVGGHRIGCPICRSAAGGQPGERICRHVGRSANIRPLEQRARQRNESAFGQFHALGSLILVDAEAAAARRADRDVGDVLRVARDTPALGGELSARTLERWTREGLVPYIRLPQRGRWSGVRFSRNQLQRWLRQRTVRER